VVEGSHKSLAQDTVEGLPGVKSVDNQLKIKGEMPAEHSDGWLSTKVKSTLLFHRNVSATGTDVYVKDGVVSLRGEASSQAQKELTGEYAKDVEGVSTVNNEMTVAKTPAKPSESISEKIDDASITAQSDRHCCLHKPRQRRVATTDGVVTWRCAKTPPKGPGRARYRHREQNVSTPDHRATVSKSESAIACCRLALQALRTS
jgi:hypothetical protein